jgi:hypothetical protein
VPRLLIQQFDCGPAAEPQPAQALVDGEIIRADRVDGAAQQRGRLRVAGREQDRETVQEEICGARLGHRSGGEGLGRPGNIQHRRPAGIEGCFQRLKHGVT